MCLRDKFRSWPIRRQLIFSFFSTTLFLCFAIFITIYIDLSLIYNKMVTETSKTTLNTTLSAITLISKERGMNILQRKSTIESILYDVKGIVSMLLGYNGIISSSSFTNWPWVTYDSYYSTNKNAFENNTKYSNTFVTYNTTTVHIYKNSTVVTTPAKDFLDKTSNLDKMLPSLSTWFFKQNILRVNIYFRGEENGKEDIIYRCFPGQNLNNSYNYKLSNNPNEIWEAYTRQLAGTPLALLSGPFLDMKGIYNASENRKQLISFTTDISISGVIYCILQVEVNIDTFGDFFNNINYLNTGFSTLVANNQFILYYPPLWDYSISKNNIRKVVDFSQQTGITKDIWKNQIVEKGKINNNVSSENVITIKLNNNQGILKEYYCSLSFLPYDYNQTKFKVWEYILLFYVEKAEVMLTETFIANTIENQNNLIMFISFNLSTMTLAIVICFCYNVAVSISNPLNKLIEIAQIINSNASQKGLIAQLQNELPVGEYQIKELIASFKKLVGFMNEERPKQIDEEEDKKKVITGQFKVNYPKNEFNSEYLNTMKIKSEITWKETIKNMEKELDKSKSESNNSGGEIEEDEFEDNKEIKDIYLDK